MRKGLSLACAGHAIPTPAPHVDPRRQAIRPRHGQGRRRQDDRLRGRGALARGQGQARPRGHVQREGAPERDARLRDRSARPSWRSSPTSGQSTCCPRRRSRSTVSSFSAAGPSTRPSSTTPTCGRSSEPSPACRSGRCSARRGGTRPSGAPTAPFKYDVVILDAPATGHGLDMLRVPKIILDVVPPGLLRRDAERAWALFQGRRRRARSSS